MISQKSNFYDSNDLSEVATKIKIFICKNINSEKIHFLFSTQMHGISGEFKNGDIFFSSWNDLPVKKDDILPKQKWNTQTSFNACKQNYKKKMNLIIY